MRKTVRYTAGLMIAAGAALAFATPASAAVAGYKPPVTTYPSIDYTSYYKQSQYNNSAQVAMSGFGNIQQGFKNELDGGTAVNANVTYQNIGGGYKLPY